jgi:hypothetical protein
MNSTSSISSHAETTSSEVSRAVDEDDCRHSETVEREGTVTCLECGLEISSELSNGPDRRVEDRNCFYSDAGSGVRCSYRRAEQKNIYKEIEKFNFPREIVNIANKLYVSVVKDAILRSPLRMAVVFACVFNAYKSIGEFKIPKELQQIFGLAKTDVANGMKYFNLNVPKDFKISTIKIADYIPVIMKRFRAKEYHIVNAIRILEFVKQRTTLLNSSCPQGIAAAICFYYCSLVNKKRFKCEDFAEIVGMSRVTIDKFSRQITEIIAKSVIKPILLTRCEHRNLGKSSPQIQT